MIEIKFTLSKSLYNEAKDFEAFRTLCKTFLISKGKGYDKFTMVSHDSFIGYITENVMKSELPNIYSDLIHSIELWEDNFDLSRIKNIISKPETCSEEDVNYVVDYFYDRYDLKINGKEVSILSDVKTALTKLTPSPSWNFLYPVVQANKDGKEAMILVYYVVLDLKELSSVNKLVLVGCTTPALVKQCKIIRAGERTRFGTISQIDNYETELSKHYFSLEKLLK